MIREMCNVKLFDKCNVLNVFFLGIKECIEMDELAQQDHTYRISREEFKRYQGQVYLTLKKSGRNTPMRLRSDFRAAVTVMNRFHRESGEEEVAESIPFQQNQSWQLAPFLPQVILGGTGTRPKAGGVHEFNSFFKWFVAVGFVYN